MQSTSFSHQEVNLPLTIRIKKCLFPDGFVLGFVKTSFSTFKNRKIPHCHVITSGIGQYTSRLFPIILFSHSRPPNRYFVYGLHFDLFQIVTVGPLASFGLIFSQYLTDLGEGTQSVTVINSVFFTAYSLTGKTRGFRCAITV